MYERDMIALSKSGARFLVIGAVAMAIHGYPHVTFDLDIIPDLDSDNLDLIIKTLKTLGYSPKVPVDPAEIKNADKREYWFREKNMKVFSFVDLKNPLNMIDLMIYSPINFGAAYKRRRKIYIKGAEIPVASVKDMLALKKAASRDKDMEDIAALEEMLKKK